VNSSPKPGTWAVYAAVRVLWFVIGWLPEGAGRRVAMGCFRLVDSLVPRYRRIAVRNLELAFPEWDQQRRRECVSRMYVYLARHLWVVARMSRIGFDNIQKILIIEGLDIVEKVIREGRGLLFATGHLGAWELSAQAFGHLVQPMDVVARPLDNPHLDAWVERVRTQTGNRVLQKSGTLREVMRALKDNRAVGFLLDQNVISPDACFVDFLGIRATASTAFAKMAYRSGAAVVPGFALWDDSAGRYVLRFEEPVPMTGDAEQDTQAIQAVIERVIRQHPEQWLWIHRRFKTRPPGDAALYQ
jgi:KDO2-lipid IV(A) lauroyltransferase